jgi:copper chaperone CopZ
MTNANNPAQHPLSPLEQWNAKRLADAQYRESLQAAAEQQAELVKAALQTVPGAEDVHVSVQSGNDIILLSGSVASAAIERAVLAMTRTTRDHTKCRLENELSVAGQRRGTGTHQRFGGSGQ